MKDSYYLFLLIILFGCNSNTQTNNSISNTSVVKIDSINQIFDNTSTHIKIDTTVKMDNINQISDSHIKIDTTVKSVFLHEYNSLVNSKLKRWIKFYKTENSSFNINEFILCSSTYLNPYLLDFLDETKMKKFLKLYKPFLIWNSDSSKAIDLYSINVILDIDSFGKKCAEFDVDCHVELIDFKNKKIIVLMQRGAFSHFDDGFWIDDNNVLITEIGKNLDNDIIVDKFIVDYHVINLNTYQTSRYCSKQSYKTDKSYLLEIFKGI